MRRLSLLLLILLGCGPDFERPSVVNSLRILTVRAEPAAVRPGETIVLTPLVVDPRGSNRIVTYAWSECVTMDGGTFDFLLPSECAKADDLPIRSAEPEIEIFIPEEAAQLAAIAEFTGQSGSFGIPVRLAVRAADEERIAIVPVTVALDSEQAPNANPTFDGLTEGGESWPEGEERTLTLTNPLRLSASWPSANAERYSYVARGDERLVTTQEVIAVNWYSSVGEFDPDVTSKGYLQTKLELFSRPAPDVNARIWVVISDGRGGVAFTERPIRVP